MKANKIYKTYLELLKKHGNPADFWPQWCARKKDNALREVISIGAILTQRTSWHNADLALKNLKRESLLSFKSIVSLADLKLLAKLIKPAGFYQTKPKRLFVFASFVINEYKSLRDFAKEDLDISRKKLLGLYGIGPETADTILLYALDKPTFVIDEYTKRLARQKKLSLELSYDGLKSLFEENLPKDATLFQNFHALIIIDQKGRKHSMMAFV